MHRIPAGVLGASGYAGRELCALIAAHPDLELIFATAHEQRGERLALPGGKSITFCAFDDAPLGDARIVFAALPHGASRPAVERARAAGAKVVDLSSDYRPGHGHADGVPYGLTEAARAAVRDASLVANPGCYPTATLLALWPLVARNRIRPGATIHVVAASGVSGAGNAPRRDLLFGEVTENFRAYATGNVHRHLPEMRETLHAFGGDIDLVFTPQLLPVARGILATMTVPVTAIDDDPMAPWKAHYAGERFIELTDAPPSLQDVAHRNVVRINAQRVAGVREPTLLVMSAIDNLMKGAAGQALQNANLMLGLDETLGLPS
ncbi:MAG TPA: N-acetyl-gamma-glutamyl-phosphate reductase [Gemmatimonadaceae bacterium]|nr:N-acetyl-gamma-glutamyl-phosphate reductase [Gemmatimonadaceae bacterium]